MGKKGDFGKGPATQSVLPQTVQCLPSCFAEYLACKVVIAGAALEDLVAFDLTQSPVASRSAVAAAADFFAAFGPQVPVEMHLIRTRL